MDYDLMTFVELKALAAEREITVPTPRPPLKLQAFDVAQALRAADEDSDAGE